MMLKARTTALASCSTALLKTGVRRKLRLGVSPSPKMPPVIERGGWTSTGAWVVALRVSASARAPPSCRRAPARRTIPRFGGLHGNSFSSSIDAKRSYQPRGRLEGELHHLDAADIRTRGHLVNIPSPRVRDAEFRCPGGSWFAAPPPEFGSAPSRPRGGIGLIETLATCWLWRLGFPLFVFALLPRHRILEKAAPGAPQTPASKTRRTGKPASKQPPEPQPPPHSRSPRKRSSAPQGACLKHISRRHSGDDHSRFIEIPAHPVSGRFVDHSARCVQLIWRLENAKTKPVGTNSRTIGATSSWRSLAGSADESIPRAVSSQMMKEPFPT